MTYQEFLEYIRETGFSNTESLAWSCIYLGEYRREPFCSGVFRDETGGWYYYSHLLGAISEVPAGEKLSEEECVERLKWDYEHRDERLAKWKCTASSAKFAEWARDMGLDLPELGIYPDRYTNRPFASGCFQDENGKWFCYVDNDERAGTEPNGTPCMEGEAFYRLVRATLRAIKDSERSEEKQRELSALAKKFANWAYRNGWRSWYSKAYRIPMPDKIYERYKRLPDDWVSFAGDFCVIDDNKGCARFNTAAEFDENRGILYRWDRIEQEQLAAADGRKREMIVQFWDKILPVAMRFGEGGRFYGIETCSGNVVSGDIREFGKTQFLCGSFCEFIEKICNGEISI